VGKEITIVRSQTKVPAGRHELRFEFEPTGAPDIRKGKGSPGRAQLYIDKKLVGQAEMAVTTPLSFGLGGGLAVGADVGSPVTTDYKAPFPFTGKLYTVTVDVSGELIKDDEMTMKAIMARQ
jgi:arylsulfatase